MSNESFPSVMPHSGSTYHLMCCCPSLLVGTTNTTILLEYLKIGSLMHYVHCRHINLNQC